MQQRDNMPDRPSDDRSADAYIDAVNAVIDLAEMAVPQLKDRGGKAAVLAEAVVKAAPVARAAAEQVPKIAPVIAPAAKMAANAVADKVPGAVGEGAGKVADAAKGAAGALGGVVDSVRNAAKNAAEVRAQEKARELARKTLLDGAGIRMSAAKFQENWDVQSKAPGGHEGYLSYSGCYVIITCDGAVRKDDYSKYRELFVGKSENIGASIHDDLVGRGNADVKYKQHVYILLYPCEKDKINQLEASLITALDADESYNRRQ